MEPPKGTSRQFLPTLIKGREVLALIDSGILWRTVMSESLFRQLGYTRNDLRPLPGVSLSTAKTGSKIPILGESRHYMYLGIGGGRTKLKFKPVILGQLNMPLNISASFLSRHGIDQRERPTP